MSSKGIVKRSEDFSKWYNELVLKADLAEHSDVRGCMIIKPYGYAIWEKIKDQLDIMFKETGHQNAYFPLLIPKSYLSKEAAHVEGFAKECAVVTHYRLKNSEDGTGVIVDPEAKLEEELIIRPTSETIIWNTYKKWIQSYRDLPILVNQWANVVRWEMRTRLFLRTSEFLWQEGHTAHATKIEAVEETEKMLEVYAQFVQEFMAVPVIKGVKSENERFAGAEETYCIEALMQDGKALQAGTSHFLGQNFAKAFDVTFADKEGNKNHVWATSWGVSTRLMGALVMTHSDDKGLVLPPKLAPIQVVIVPIYKNEDQLLEISEYANSLIKELKSLNISVKFDNDDNKKPGWKFAEYEMKGVPLRIAIGPRDMENQTVELARRDNLSKSTVSQLDLPNLLLETLNLIQNDLFTRSSLFLKENTYSANSIDQMIEILDAKGGFIEAFWNGDSKSEHKIKELTKATIRCIPLNENQTGNCILTGEPNSKKVIFARAY
jgi:prolyl-tRNA synthetase|tara:strand:- start:591 stop:2066 length:1476 start_codon:yes stop_codon:yes gene_type:complete